MSFSFSNPPRVLALHAHPDDVEILCGGTLALLKQRGCVTFSFSMSPGDKGSAELGAEEIAAVRRKEGQRGAEILGATYECLEFRDLEIDVNHAGRQKVTEALRRTQPDIILTASPIDYMNDHEATSRLVRDACFSAAVPNYKTNQPDPAPLTTKIPALYYVDPLEGIDWFGKPIPPQFIVDISETIELKLQALAAHESQREWLRRQHDMDEYLDSCRRWSAKRGDEGGFAYGEGFRQYLGHPYPHENVLLELLGSGVTVMH
ncbi:MAG TPA: PIG-L family deacetylase [Planctomicrobium sp.]|nr:PIG-L family deacetylase [Planctomicrobium sp.]